MLLQMMLFLEAVAMVTINPFAWEETIHRMFYFPQGALWHVKAYVYSETEIKKKLKRILCLSNVSTLQMSGQRD